SSAQQRMDALESLRGACYEQEGRNLHYSYPDTRTLCETVISEEDACALKGAQTILNWLNGDRDLLIASHRDYLMASHELLRGLRGGAIETRPETLLIAADEPDHSEQPRPTRPSLWRRLFARNKDAGSL